MRKICELETGFDLSGPNIASVSCHAFSQPILNLAARLAFVDASDSFRSLPFSALRKQKDFWTRLTSVHCTLHIAIFYYKALHFPWQTDRMTNYLFFCYCLQCYHTKSSLNVWVISFTRILQKGEWWRMLRCLKVKLTSMSMLSCRMWRKEEEEDDNDYYDNN